MGEFSIFSNLVRCAHKSIVAEQGTQGEGVAWVLWHILHIMQDAHHVVNSAEEIAGAEDWSIGAANLGE